MPTPQIIPHPASPDALSPGTVVEFAPSMRICTGARRGVVVDDPRFGPPVAGHYRVREYGVGSQIGAVPHLRTLEARPEDIARACFS